MIQKPLQSRLFHALQPLSPFPTTTSRLIDSIWTRLLTKLFSKVQAGHLVVILPSNLHLSFGDQTFNPITITIHTNRLLFKLLSGNTLSLAEGNLQGQWSCSDLLGLFMFLKKNEAVLQKIVADGWLKRRQARRQHLRRNNSRSGSRRNIAHHYDLGNDFYGLWLDPSMTYSSAYQLKGNTEQDLLNAQNRKYQHVLDLLNLEANSKLLEIGCGWGSMALAAAKQGHSLYGVTLSKEQLAYAQSQSVAHAMKEHIDLSLTDYRDLEDEYDGIISIEMIEAVGEEHWPEYFSKIRNSLKPGKRAVLQAITISDDCFANYQKNVDFIQHYIFPGGFLPSPNMLQQQIAQAGLTLKTSEFFGSDYAGTLNIWRKRFLQNWPSIEALGFDMRFKRMWLYYLDYCEAGFREGSINVGFYVIEKPMDRTTSNHHS